MVFWLIQLQSFFQLVSVKLLIRGTSTEYPYKDHGILLYSLKLIHPKRFLNLKVYLYVLQLFIVG